jgi:hypothetical protein
VFALSFIGRIVLLALAVLLLWALFAGESGAGGPERSYRVKPGDTLWSIAARHYAGDPREAIYCIAKRNHLAASVIVPGERLVLPSAR